MIIKSEKVGSSLIFHTDDGFYGRYDFKDGNCYKTSKRKPNEYQVQNLVNMFTGCYYTQILETFVDEKYKEFLRTIAKIENTCSNMGTFLNRIEKHKNVEQYILLGLNVHYFNPPKNPVTIYNKRTLAILKENGHCFSKDFESTYIKYKDFIDNILNYTSTKDEDFMRGCLGIINGGYVSTVQNLIDNYNYEYKKLLDYILDYLPNREGCDWYSGIGLLNDYVNMISIMRTKFVKYPKCLRTTHDITVMNYRIHKKEYDEILFERMVDKSLEHKIGDYVFIIPKETKDVVNEGVQQNQCIGSYIQHILSGRSQLVFMRHKENIDKSVVSIEIQQNKIVQAKGYFNASLKEDEFELLTKYAKAKNLEIGEYL